MAASRGTSAFAENWLCRALAGISPAPAQVSGQVFSVKTAYFAYVEDGGAIVFHPDIQPHIAVAQRHRAEGILARRIASEVAVVERCDDLRRRRLRVGR